MRRLNEKFAVILRCALLRASKDGRKRSTEQHPSRLAALAPQDDVRVCRLSPRSTAAQKTQCGFNKLPRQRAMIHRGIDPSVE
jgi:hypothetical protein